MSYGIKLHISGDFACFTRPEMKVERVSYDVITPSAARGIPEAIYWKPQIRWIIDRIHVLFNALENAFQFDQSAARPAGSMAPRGLLVFKHDSALGKAPSHSLFDRLEIESFEHTPADDGRPARIFKDYASRITFDGQLLDDFIKPGDFRDLGNGISLIRRI